MARTARRRRRKHRGTQSGSVDRRRATRPRSRQEARARAKQQTRHKRGDLPPTWSSAVNRGLFGAGVFLLMLVVIFRRPVATSVALAAFMVLFYIPLGHAIDGYMYKRRQAAKRRERERRARGE